MRRWRCSTDALQDLRYALRLAARAPAFFTIAVVTLALGIGANTAVFSVIDSVLLRPLPYRDPNRLVVVWNRNIKEQGPSKLFQGYRDFDNYSHNAISFESVSMATWAVGPQLWRRDGPAREVFAMPVDASFFATLGVPAFRGRTFLPSDAQAGCSVVVSHQFWHEELGAEIGAIGQILDLEHRACIVRGVMPAGFVFYPAAVEMWTLADAGFLPPREQLGVGVFARLREGATLQQAQSEVASLYAALHQTDRERDLSPVIYPLQEEFTWLASRTLRATLITLSGAVALVLLIACLNLASLLLGRSTGRVRELAVRAALGAGRRRLMRQLLAEGFLLALIGTGLGVLLAFAAVRYFGYARPIELPPGVDPAIHWRTLIFTAALSVATTLAFGLVPAWRGSHIAPGEVLKAGGRGSSRSSPAHRLVSGLVFAEVALSAVLLATAGLLSASVMRMAAEPLGFAPDHLLATAINLPRESYSEPSRQVQLYRTLQERVARVPGVRESAVTSGFVLGNAPLQELQVGDEPASPQRRAMQYSVSAECFRVFGVPLVRGRSFTDHDGQGAQPVAIVNAALARKYFRDSAVGQTIRIGDHGEYGPWLAIVGVVGNVKTRSVYAEMSWDEPAMVFRPLPQQPSRTLSLVIRTAGPHEYVGETVRRQIAEIDPELPVRDLVAVDAWAARQFAYPRFRALSFTVFAGLALVLAVVGVYAVLGQMVASRRQEFAVRVALGASRRHIFWLVSRHGGVPVAAGLAAGITGSLVSGTFISHLLYGVRPSDGRILTTVSVALMSVAVCALALPARRAARVDPITALREE
jgi:putative ABC transport system permease protein